MIVPELRTEDQTANITQHQLQSKYNYESLRLKNDQKRFHYYTALLWVENNFYTQISSEMSQK